MILASYGWLNEHTVDWDSALIQDYSWLGNVMSWVWDTEFEVSVRYPNQEVEDLISFESDDECFHNNETQVSPLIRPHARPSCILFLSIVTAYFGSNKWLFLLFISHHSLWKSDSLLKEEKIENNRVMEATVVGYAEGPV